MIPLQTTDQHIKVSMKTWLLCEASVHDLLTGYAPPRQQIIKERSDFARALFS